MRVIVNRPLDVVSTNVPETEDLWVQGTTYAMGANVRHNHRVYVSTVADNKGNQPDVSPAAWSDRGATNAYAMFDEYVNTVTEQAGDIQVVLGAAMMSAVALFGLAGETVRLTMTNPKEGIVLDELMELRRFVASGTQNCASWEEYFFGEEAMIEDLWRILPAYGDGTTLAIEVTDTQGGTCCCSHVVLGHKRNLGATQFGLSLEMADYSKKATDEFGRTYLAPGAYAFDAVIGGTSFKSMSYD